MRIPKPKKPTKRQVERFLLNSVIIVVGNAITALGSALFIIPNGFVMGGTTGLGIFVRNMLKAYASVSAGVENWIVTITVYAANILLFVVGTILLGKKFAVTTLAGTLLYPTFMSLFGLVSDAYVASHGAPVGMAGEGANLLLCALFGALLFGFGIGIVVRVGASTGGTDIPPLILNKYFGTPVSATLRVIDMAIIALQFIAKVPITYILYGVLITLLSSLFVGIVAPIGMKRTQVKIVSRKYEEIRDMILTKISRGVTVLYGQTGYLRQDCHVVLTVISHRQLVTLKSEVQRIDPEAFMTISVVSEVRGRGFHSDGVDFLMPQDKENKALEALEAEARSAEKKGE